MNKRLWILLVLAALIVFSFVFLKVQRNNPIEESVIEENTVEEKAVQGDLYVIRGNGRYGYINRAGLVAIKPQFEDGYNFYEGLARVAIYHKYGFIDNTGKLVIPTIYYDAGDFSEGMALVGVDNKYGFIDKTGKVVVPLQYESVSAFSEGMAGIYIKGKWGYIDKTGKVVIKPQFENAGSFSNGLAPVSESGLYGYINTKGQYIIKPQYTFAYNFKEGLAEVGLNGKYGFINTKGKMVVQPVYSGTQDFNEGMAAVQQGEKWGFIDKTGHVAIKPVYETADSFSEGRAAVFDSTNWGYIDEKGNVAIKPQYGYAEKFYKGLAAVRIDDIFSYIDRNGKLVWHEPQDIAIQGMDGVLGRLVKMKIKSEQYDLVIRYPYAVDMKDKGLQNHINEILRRQSGIDYKGQPNETYRQDYDVMVNTNGIMSILNNSYMYMKDAAHGLSMRSSINIDMVDGRLYDLEDLFKPGANYKDKLNDIIKKQLAKEDIPLLREYEGIKDKQEYYLTDKELVVYYQLYDYTPYAYGFLEFYIPYESISDMIDKKGPIGRIMTSK